MEKKSSLRSPNTSHMDLSPLPLVIKMAIRELSMIAVDANRVDAIMLFLSVCTARTPFFDVSCYIHSVCVMHEIINEIKKKKKKKMDKPPSWLGPKNGD